MDVQLEEHQCLAKWGESSLNCGWGWYFWMRPVHKGFWDSWQSHHTFIGEKRDDRLFCLLSVPFLGLLEKALRNSRVLKLNTSECCCLFGIMQRTNLNKSYFFEWDFNVMCIWIRLCVTLQFWDRSIPYLASGTIVIISHVLERNSRILNWVCSFS